MTSRHALATMTVLVGFLIIMAPGCAQEAPYDVVIRNGLLVDGSGSPGVRGDIAIRADTIAAVGSFAGGGATEIDADGLVVAPGFINMLSWATTSLIIDGHSQSDIRQGVTLEVFGEGESEGPLTEEMADEALRSLVGRVEGEERAAELLDVPYGPGTRLSLPWRTLGEYLGYLEEKGVSTNVASFVGATTVRVHEVGYENRAPDEAELTRMQDLVRDAMREGALGVGSSLIYAPAFYADTDELVALASAAGEYGGMYISHMRSEGNNLLAAVDELIEISRRAGVPAEIYHLKAAGKQNWDKLDEVIDRVESARDSGQRITADMYLYTAGSTGLDAAMPPWVQEGGFGEWRRRLMDPAIRRRVAREIMTPTDEWENLFLSAGPEGTLLVGFRNKDLRDLIGKTLAEVADSRGTSPAETIMDLVVEDSSRVDVVYFLMSEENVARQVALPWMSFDSDAGSMAPEGLFLQSNPHPRAYGNFARLLAKYVREEKVVPVEEAVRRLTSFPAENLGLRRRGRLQPGYYADVVVFDPDRIQDHATFEEPHQYSTGVQHVLVNGVSVLYDGEHTGAKPGRFVRGPGWTGWSE
ncbi:MAG: D-aminoacylase [Rhodothermales bacterium]